MHPRGFKPIVILGFFFLLSVTACRPKTNTDEMKMNQSRISPSQVQQAVDTQNQIWANSMRNGHIDSLEMVYAQDSWILPPNHEVVKGVGDIKNFMQNMIPMGLSEIQLTSDELYVLNDSAAIETGNYLVYINDEPADQGKYVAFWKNDDDKWYIYRDMWNSDNPVAQPSDTTMTESNM